MTAEATTTLTDRTATLLRAARYLNLATVSPDGTPWIATLEYAWLTEPLRFVFGSSSGSRHSRDIATTPVVSGALFTAGGPGFDVAAVDGAQFTGRCRELHDAGDLARFRPLFYEAVFPDPAERERWALPEEQLRPPAAHRLYLIDIERWWLVDTSTWAEDRIDRRVELPLGPNRAPSAWSGALEGGVQ